jgi:hypothetical protein
MRAKLAVSMGMMALLCTARAPALGVASISLSSGTTPVTWSNVGTADLYLTPDNGNALTVTGQMQTTPLTGAGSIVISAPAAITGTHGAPLPASNISVTCSGSSISGQTYVANKTPLVAGGSVTCATYSAGFVSLSVSVTIQFFLDDRTIAADSYLTSSTAFGIVATAS